MTEEMLTALLAQQLMGWRVGPDRYLLGQRRWLPRWRFQPTRRAEDAFRLLEHAALQEFTMSTTDNGDFWVTVRVAGTTGEARAACKPRAITFAVARAIGLDIELPE